jgi:hypothetical protein
MKPHPGYFQPDARIIATGESRDICLNCGVYEGVETYELDFCSRTCKEDFERLSPEVQRAERRTKRKPRK